MPRFTSRLTSSLTLVAGLCAAAAAQAHPGHGAPDGHAHPELLLGLVVLAAIAALAMRRRT